MNRLFQRALNTVMSAFVGSGVTIDESGRLCLPDGLTPERVHRFIEICMDEAFPCPRDAIHALFLRLGVSPRAVALLSEIIDARGDVDFSEAIKKSRSLMAAVPEFKQIPARFHHFLVHDLALASKRSQDLEEAVASARVAAAKRIGCSPTWEAVLENHAQLDDVLRAWRERPAA